MARKKSPKEENAINPPDTVGADLPEDTVGADLPEDEGEGPSEHLPGMEPKKIPAVHNAALKYRDAVRPYKEASDKVKNAKALLIEKMHENNLKSYRFGNLVIELTEEEKIKVTFESEETE